MSKKQKFVVARYRYIGDTLLALPFVKALRRQNPQAEIHFLVGQDAYPIMALCPDIDRAIVFEPKDLGFWNAVLQVKAERYDRAYILKRSFSSALIMRLAKVPNRIGFETDMRGFLLTHRVPYRGTQQHEANCFLDLIPKTENFALDLDIGPWLPSELVDNVQDYLSFSDGPRIVLHATSTNPAKCWPIDHFVTLGTMLIRQHQAKLYFLGTQSEKDLYDHLISQLPLELQDNARNLCGQTSLVESIALLKKMDLVVANDSGMIHMAAAVNTPVIALFGPMDPNQWHPLSQQSTVVTHPNLSCRPCRMKITCDYRYPCLTEITPNEVLAACKPYLIRVY